MNLFDRFLALFT